MKNALLVLTALLIMGIVKAQNSGGAEKPGAPLDIKNWVEFKELNHDFGKITYGKPVSFDLQMKNIGPDSLKITNVQVSCGCTTPKWEAGPYAPGAVFSVTLGFNGYAEGPFEKSLAIFFDRGLSQQIKFHGEGVKPEAAAQ